MHLRKYIVEQKELCTFYIKKVAVKLGEIEICCNLDGADQMFSQTKSPKIKSIIIYNYINGSTS